MIAHQVRRVHSPLAFAAAAEAKLASLPLDVIHDMGVGWYCDIFHPHGGSWASVTARKVLLLPRWLRPLKRGLHHVMPRYYVFRKLMARQYADHGQIMVALSQSVADDFARFHQVARRRIRIVYNGVDAERFSPARCAPHRQAMRRRLGIGPRDGPVVDGGHESSAQGDRHAAAGAGASAPRGGGRSGWWSWAASTRAPGGGWRRGWAWPRRSSSSSRRKTSFPIMPPADVYVHPTIYDTCSLVVLEAAACGLPIVTTRCNGAAELFHDGRDVALVADPADDEAFAAAVEGLLDAAARRRMGDAARQTAHDANLRPQRRQHRGLVRGGGREAGHGAGGRSPGVDRARHRAGPGGRRPVARRPRPPRSPATRESRRENRPGHRLFRSAAGRGARVDPAVRRTPAGPRTRSPRGDPVGGRRGASGCRSSPIAWDRSAPTWAGPRPPRRNSAPSTWT